MPIPRVGQGRPLSGASPVTIPTFSGNGGTNTLAEVTITSSVPGISWAIETPAGDTITPTSTTGTTLVFTPTMCGVHPFSQVTADGTFYGTIRVGAKGTWIRRTLTFPGSHDFKTQGSTYAIGGVTLTATNAASAQVMRVQGGYLEIHSNDASVLYNSATWTAPYITISPTELNSNFTRYKRSRLQFLVPTPPDTGASVAELLLGWQGESATIANVVRFKGGVTQNVNAYQIISGGSNTTGDTAAVGKLAVIERFGEQFRLYYGTTAAYLEEEEAGQTLLRAATHTLTMSSADYWDGGTNILIANHNGGSTGTPSLLQISGIRLDCEV